MANSQPEQHSPIAFDSVKGYNEHHHARRAKDAYKSKESPGWRKIEIPEKQNYGERKGSGSSNHGDGPKL